MMICAKLFVSLFILNFNCIVPCIAKVHNVKMEKIKYSNNKKTHYLNSCRCGEVCVKSEFLKGFCLRKIKKGSAFRGKRSINGQETLFTDPLQNDYQNYPEKTNKATGFRSSIMDQPVPDTGAQDFRSDTVTVNPEVRIVNGKDARTGEYPWFVLLVNMVNEEFCGGSIINQLFILTAAHCTVSFEKHTSLKFPYPKNIDVVLDQPSDFFCKKKGSKTFSFNSDKRKGVQIKKIINHPKYSEAAQLIYDFAIIRLDQKLKFDSRRRFPICLPPMSATKIDFTGGVTVMGGYGRTTALESDYVKDPCKLQLVHQRIIKNNDGKCKPYSSHPEVQMCAHGKGDTCSGDSGGPMILTQLPNRDKFKRLILAGITSYGPVECNKKNVAGVYARVTKVMKWLIPNIQAGECANNRSKKRSFRSLSLKKEKDSPQSWRKSYRTLLMKLRKDFVST